MPPTAAPTAPFDPSERTSTPHRSRALRSWTRRLAAGALALMAAVHAPPAAAQVPAVPNAFPKNTYTPGQLLYRNVGQGRITNIVYHNGFIYTNTVGAGDRKAWRFTTPSNPATLTDVTPGSMPPFMDVGNHAHTKVGDFVLGGIVHESAIMRSGVGANTIVDFPNEVGVSASGHNLFYPWSVNFDWVQYAGLQGTYPTRLYRGNTLLWEADAYADHGVAGYSILLGNILLVVSDDSDLGILSYDISPLFQSTPAPPVLLDKLTGAVGAYLPAVWQNYLVLAQNDTGTIDVVDFSDPTDLRLVTTIDVTGNPAWRGEHNVPYVQAQDNFIFAKRHKVDMETFEPVLELDQVGNNRPGGSVSGTVDTSQYMMPLGNLLITGGYSFSGYDALAVWCHQAAPDTRAPYVGYHIPRPGQTNFPVGAPVSLLIHETLESYTIINGQTVILRPVGGVAVDCYTSFSHDDVLTITPVQNLASNTTYEVVIPANGIKDAAGNGIEAYSFTFSTGSTASGGNLAPTINSFTATSSPTNPNTSVGFSVSATDPEANPLEYRFSFGDGTATTAWTTSAGVNHTFTAAGHYEAKVQVRDLKPGGAHSVVTETLTVTVATNPPSPRPTQSSLIAVDAANRRVWVANSDADTVTLIHADTNAKVAEVNLNTLLSLSGRIDPRSVAVDGSGNVWVACHDADRIAVINGSTRALIGAIDTGHGSAPVGVAANPAGTSVFATLTGKGQLKRYTVSTRAESGSIDLGPWPRAIAVSGNGTRVLVTRFISPEHWGEVWDVNATSSSSLSLTRTFKLQRDSGNRGQDGSSNGKGVPNYLANVTISPDGEWAWVSGLKHNTFRGQYFNQGTGTNGDLDPEHMSRAVVCRINLVTNSEPDTGWSSSNRRLDVDNSDSPAAVVFSPRGDWGLVALQGNNEVAVFDDIELRGTGAKITKWRIPVGLAPQGFVLDATTGKLFVMNFMDRSITVHNLSAFFATGSRALSPVNVSAVSSEKLASNVLAGKKIFYNAAKKTSAGFDQISRDSYISCASCHVDGAHDGRTWDFTERGEGLRNTIDLRGKAGMGHGNVHWTANFDEIHDFENDIRLEFEGKGLLSDSNFNATQNPLGSPKAGLSSELDQLAAYVASLDNTHLPRSPFRNADGTMTAAATAGQAIFQAQSCATCHGGTKFTDSTGGVGNPVTLHDVGTIRTSSGERLGATLTGIDTPSLLGVWATAPYFHDGSAQALADVFNVAGGVIYQAESGSLAGGAIIPGFIDINADSSVHGRYVELHTTGARVTLSGISGGSGGTGAVELRFGSLDNCTLTVRVNGTPFTVTAPADQAKHDWRRARIENVSLNSGTGNTIQIEATSGRSSVDDVTVSTASDLSKANPHRRILALGASDRDNLLAYLRELEPSATTPGLRDPENPANTTGGLDRELYTGTWSVLPDFDSLTPTTTDTSANFNIAPGDNFAYVFTGYVEAPTDGQYTFFTSSDDGSKLYIGTTEVVDNDGLHGTQERSGVIGLKAGKHAIRVTMFENNGGEILQVRWQGPGIAKQLIPDARLFRPSGGGGTGQISYEEWTGVTGTSIALIPLTTTPSATGTLGSFEIPADAKDNYGVRVRGYITPPTTGNYTFWFASDDNGELWLGTSDAASSRQRIAYVTSWASSREWNKQSTQRSAPVALTGGQRYYIEALMKEGGGGDNLAVSWKLNDTTHPANGDGAYIVPGTVLSPWDGGAGSGLKATYWDNQDFTGTAVTQTDATVDYDWASGAPVTGIAGTTFSVRWEGEVQAVEAGSYIFRLTGDDGVRLFIAGSQVIDGWQDQPATAYESMANSFSANQKKTIRVEYYQAFGGSVCKLEWKRPGQANFEVVPQAQLFPAP